MTEGFARRALGKYVARSLMAGPLVLSSLTALSQVGSASKTAGPADPSFDVVSIKRNMSGAQGFGMRITDDGYSLTNEPLSMLIVTAYGLATAADRVVGEPGWVKDERYDIEARVTDSDVDEFKKMKPEERRVMLQQLLADRFQLKAHHETRDARGYALVVVANGPKIKPAVPNSLSPNASKDPDGSTIHGMFRTGAGQITDYGSPISVIAPVLERIVGRPVLDKTGLSGDYDFVLNWTPDDQPSTSGPSGGGTSPIDQNGASIFTALQEQLGLRLESATTAVDYLVVDTIQRPSEN